MARTRRFPTRRSPTRLADGARADGARAGGARALVTLMLGTLALGGCALTPAQTANLPQTYLRQALAAVQAHDADTAVNDINRAENIWLGRNTPFSDPFFDFNPEAMREMARARQSVQMGRWGDADYYLRAALTHPSTLTPG